MYLATNLVLVELKKLSAFGILLEIKLFA